MEQQQQVKEKDANSFSLIDFMEPFNRDFLNIDKIIKNYHPKLDFLQNAKEMLKHRLLILLFEFILRSECLFKIKKGKEKLKELMIKYVLEREVIQNEIIGIKRNCNEHIDLFDNLKDYNNEINKDCKNDKNNLKKRKVNEKLYTLNNYFKSYFEKYNIGELGQYAKLQKLNEDFDTEKLMNFILQHFDYNPQILIEEDRDPILIFIGLTSILEYFASEIIQLSGNASKDLCTVFSPFTMNLAITLDEELAKIALNSIYFNEIDLNYFIGSDLKEIPEINLKNNLQNNLQNNSLQSDNLYSTIPNELHTLILRYFDNLNNLLKMRLVCKNWNYFILKDKNIWKYLTFHSLIKENIFNSIDSTFTINEMENILQNSLTLPNSPLCDNSAYLRILKYFVKQNDWFNIYNLLVKSNLNIKKIICDKIDNYNNNYKNNLTDNSFRVSIFGALNHLQSKSIDQHLVGITKIGGILDAPKNKLADFCKLSNDYLFIAQINCKEISAFLSARLLPKTGMIYFFINQSKHTPLVLYEDFDNINEPLFKVCDPTFSLVETMLSFPLKESVLYNQQKETKKYNFEYEGTKYSMLVPCQTQESYCGACSSTTLNGERIKKPSAVSLDEIILLSTDICLTDSDEQNMKNVTFKIKLNDLKRKLFEKTMLEIIELVDCYDDYY
ncbi:hypothetical protein ABK040_012073 [Willaertia magna]